MDSIAYDARIRELEADVREQQAAHETRLLTILMTVNGTALVLLFNAVVNGRLVNLWAFVAMAALFALGAAAAFLASVRGYLTGRETNRLLAELIMVAINRSSQPTAEEQLAEALEHDNFADRMDAISRRGQSFTWLIVLSGTLFVVGIVAACTLLMVPSTLEQPPTANA